MNNDLRRRIEARVGTTLAEKYKLVRVLGAGGMGAVYEAQNTWTERRVAVKVMLGDAAGDADTSARFIREARAASRIAHPNIVDILDMGQDPADGALFIVQEFLVGRDLRRLIDERGALPPRDALETLTPVMSALVAAHRKGVVHRDLKPENIFLAKTPTGGTVPKVIDFGIAKVIEAGGATLTQSGAAMGTPYYMSPEQARGEKSIDAQTDVWAMGVVLFEVLAGRCPFEGDNYNALLAQILTAPIPTLESVAPTVPKPLGRVVARALKRDREQRFRTMAEFLGALLDCQGLTSDAWYDNLRSTLRPALQAPVPDAAEHDDDALAAKASAGDAVAPVEPWTTAKDVASTLGRSAKEISTPTPLRRSPVAWGVGALLAFVAVGSAAVLVFRSTSPPANVPTATLPTVVPASQAPATFEVAVSVQPPTASIELDHTPVGSGVFARPFRRDGVEHELLVRADGFIPARVLFRDEAPPSPITLTPLEATNQTQPRSHANAARRSATIHPSANDAAVAQPHSSTQSAPSSPGTGVNGAPIVQQE